MRARDGARSGSDVIAVIGAGLPAVGKLVDGDLVHIARARRIAADRRVIVEHAIDHGPGVGLAHGVCGTGDGGDAIVGTTALEGTGQARENRRGLRGIGLSGLRLSGIGLYGSGGGLRGSPLLLSGH